MTVGVLGKRKAPWSVERLARSLAFWHGQRISHEGKTVAYWNGGGNFSDAPNRYSDRHWQDYTAAAEMVMHDLCKRKK